MSEYTSLGHPFIQFGEFHTAVSGMRLPTAVTQ